MIGSLSQRSNTGDAFAMHVHIINDTHSWMKSNYAKIGVAAGAPHYSHGVVPSSLKCNSANSCCALVKFRVGKQTDSNFTRSLISLISFLPQFYQIPS